MNYNQWEIKQILDIVSKGINSVIMNKPDIEISQLETLARNLVQIYSSILEDLKEEKKEKGLDVDIPVSDEN